MQTKITGEQPFQVLSTSFTIGPSSSGYDLYFSADGREYTNLFTVGAGVNRQVTQVAAGSYYLLSGNTDEVTINWILNCESGSGGGGGGYVLPPATQNTLGGVKIGSGVTVASDGTISVEGGGGASYREFFINNMTDAERAELYTEIYTTLSGNTDSPNLPQIFSGYRFYIKYDIDGQRWCEAFFSNFEGDSIWIIGCKPPKLSYPFVMFRIGAILHSDGSVDYMAENAYMPPIPYFSSVAFGNGDLGGLSYNTSTGEFTLGGVDYASGDTTTPVQDVYDYNLVINGLLTRTGEFDDGAGTLYKCINVHTLTITDNGEDITLTSPVISMKGITSYTVDDIEFNREITFDYGAWKLVMDVAESNVGINLRMQHS